MTGMSVRLALVTVAAAVAAARLGQVSVAAGGPTSQPAETAGIVAGPNEASPPTRAAGLSAWAMPKRTVRGPADRQGWRPAAQADAPADGLALENRQIVLIAQPGSAGPVLYTRSGQGEATRVDLVLRTASGAAAIERVELQELGAGGGTLRVTAGDCQADLTVQKGPPLVTVQPVRGAGALEVRAKARYAALPDFSGHDVVYDPARFKRDMLLPPAENFLLNFVEGNRAIVMCVWPGALTEVKGGAKSAPSTKSAARDPVVALMLEGEGPDRHFGAARIEFLDAPIHVAVLERENLWCDRDISGLAQQPTKIDWRRPFNALWRADMLVAEGKKWKHLVARSQSYTFLDGPKPDYQAFFSKDDTYLSPAGQGQENRYDRVLIYAPNRRQDTPLDVYTPVDIMRRTLGEGPCEYVLSRMDVRAKRSAGKGDTKPAGEDATATPIPPDTPEQAELRKELAGQGYIYLPRGHRLYRINADGSDLRVIKEFPARQNIGWGQVSWDGKWVAVAVSGATLDGTQQPGEELRLVKYDGSETRTIFHDPEAKGWTTRLYCAWTPDSAWVLISHGTRVDAVHRETGRTKKVLEVEKGGIAHLTSDRQWTFYFWAAETAPPGNAFAVDKDCNLVKGLYNCGMITWCNPKVSPDGAKMARHDHCYPWGGGVRGWISERPLPDGKSGQRYFFPADENMPCRGVQEQPFWSPDGRYLGYDYLPDAVMLNRAGLPADKGLTVIVVSRISGGPMVWLLPFAGVRAPSWGPVPQDDPPDQRGR